MSVAIKAVVIPAVVAVPQGEVAVTPLTDRKTIRFALKS
jgi:hypothetical protein